jgi:hypothetical protein
MPTKNDFIIQIEADIENETELVDFRSPSTEIV